MMTLIEKARAGTITPLMKRIALDEHCTPQAVRSGLCDGTIVIPKNAVHALRTPCAVGKGLRTKINANIGTSRDASNISRELKKLRVATRAGADAVMDLSTGTRHKETLAAIMKHSTLPVGTVPMYSILIDGLKRRGSVARITTDDMFEALEAQAKRGVDFFTIHAGITKRLVAMLAENPRLLGIVSRGGAFLAQWIMENRRENPFYEHFDRVIDIARRYEITLSLGDGLRPGAIADATDRPQITELITLGELQKRACDRGVQVMIEGPGHVPIDQIEANVQLEKALCNGAPFYVLGPLVTDIAPGYDHITSAIGGALAASKGADFLCYVTPAEHLRLPSIEDVKEGVIAAKIAAHAADIVKNVPGAREHDRAMSRARGARNWHDQFKLAIDTEKPRAYRASSHPATRDACTMCGEFCSMKISEKCFRRG